MAEEDEQDRDRRADPRGPAGTDRRPLPVSSRHLAPASQRPVEEEPAVGAGTRLRPRCCSRTARRHCRGPRIPGMSVAPNAVLRPATPADIERASEAILADDWGDRRAWFRFATSHPECRIFVAEGADGAIVGTGVATISGPVAWIGTIWVASSARGQGIGRALTVATIEPSRPVVERWSSSPRMRAGPSTNASDSGVQTWYRTMEAPGLAGPVDTGVGGSGHRTGERHVARSRPRSRVDGLLGPCGHRRGPPAPARGVRGTGDDPGPDDGCRRPESVRDPGAVGRRGDDRRRRRRCARDPASSTRGRRARSAGSRRDPSNEAGARVLAEEGWTEAWRAPRLNSRGTARLAPQHIWGQFNHALG